MNTQQQLQAICMDLKRAAIGYHRGSSAMGKRFLAEAIKRKQEISRSEIKTYIQNVLDKLEVLPEKNPNLIAEEALVFSTVIQNYCLKMN